MTSDQKGLQPPLPSGTPLFSPPPNRLVSQVLKPTPELWPRQALAPSLKAPDGTQSQDASEPSFKKPRLEDSGRPPPMKAATERAPRVKKLDRTQQSGCATGIEHQQESRVHEPRLFPPRPGGQALASHHRNFLPLAIERAARRGAVPVKAHVPETPSWAPRYHEDAAADFYPWTGHHPEDLLNEVLTKNGFEEKARVAPSDPSTARPSVWSTLKHKSGSQILSSLLINTLDQRQAYGTIIANSTFKPPPRVTLTDTKREAWLRDLANPLIPLRRLSRTIPHGIRGRVLLEHCLTKDIPTDRAVWLARCVGANEIRAFKRKGTGGVFTIGGENKWIKDWTNNIEQFLESIIETVDSPEWKMKINYGLRLASQVYAESLLDCDQYLNWLIRSMKESDLDSLPIWLLVQELHHQDLLKHRQRGRRLVCAVLDHIYVASLSIHQALHQPVLQQLMRLARSIMTSAPSCCLLPNDWNKYREILQNCVCNDNNDLLRMSFESISRRNTQLQKDYLSRGKQMRTSLRQQVVEILDTLATKPDYTKVASQCLRLKIGDGIIVKICLEWSSTINRSGHFRTYAAARLLRTWNRLGIEIQASVFEFLATEADGSSLNRESLYKLLAALVTSGHLSVAQYLQWLIARGSLRNLHSWDSDCAYDVGLLLQLPLHVLPPHVLNLRQILVSSALGALGDVESLLTASVKAKLAGRIPGFFPPVQSLTNLPDPAGDYPRLSQTVKSSVARWIRQTLIRRLHASKASRQIENVEGSQQTNRPAGDSIAVLTLDQFAAMRQVLEDMREFDILADILDLISDHVHGSVLTAITDTINFYFDIFFAIGAAYNLFRNLYTSLDAYQGLEFERPFLESLLDLCCRFPHAHEEKRRIRKKMSANTTKLSAMACSPISDTMVEAVQSSEPAFADEMDHMLASGTSMDKQTLTRVFETFLSHLEKSCEELSPLISRFSQLLATLRGFGPTTFDMLLSEWLQDRLYAIAPKMLSSLLISMLCFQAISFKIILQVVTRNLETVDSHSHTIDLVLDVLDFIISARSEHMPRVDCRCYRVLDELDSLLQTTPYLFTAIIRKAIEASQARSESLIKIRATGWLKSAALRDLAQLILLKIPESKANVDPSSNQLYLDTGLQTAIGEVLHRSGSGNSENSSFEENIKGILRDISNCGILSGVLELRAALASAAIPLTHSTEILSKLIIERASTSSNDQVNLWVYLVSELPESYGSVIRDRAQSEILTWATWDLTSTKVSIPCLITIIEATASVVPVVDSSSLIERVVDALKPAIQRLSPESRQTHAKDEVDQEFQRFDVFLRLLIVHQSAIRDLRYPQSVLFHLLIALSFLLISPLLMSHPSFSHRIFDILCLLTDSVSDDIRSRCIYILRDHHRVRDPRLSFIFGYSDDYETEWLQLVTKPVVMTETRATGTMTTASRTYPLRRWETMQDATPIATENDTSLDLTLFGTRKSVM